ncbi:glycosyltransferase [Aquiflexum sp. TKW24L]|uniref:glycosyltransferase n=1 Tax=Aquiflexum sp. TKW24L TaxID=2942212 RepID=UPI0020BDDF00|nr:glycosyltransferase [Aquiflexum sp. TKW24L]MCL6260780.1 glycosyltransferase [Aquiflexum sp. TKW24L]
MFKFFFLQHSNIEIIVENGVPRGGSVVETLVWMKALHGLAHEVFQAKLEDDDRPLMPEFEWVKPVKIYHSQKYSKFGLRYFYRLPKLFLALQKTKCNYLYTSIPSPFSFYVSLICKAIGVKHIIRIANDKNVDLSLDKSLSPFDKFLVGMSYRLADFIVTQNEFQYQGIKSQFHGKKVFKLFNPIVLDYDYLHPRKEATGYIAWVANFRHQKNLKLLYEISLICKNEMFKIAGIPLIPMDEETEIYVEKLKTLSNVEFVGQVSQSGMLEFMKMAKILLSTSRYEGFSNTFLEAMTVGMPIFSTDTVNPDGIIDKFDLGILYKDAKDFKSKLDAMELSEFQIMSQNTVDYVTKNHDHLMIGRNFLGYLTASNLP